MASDRQTDPQTPAGAYPPPSATVRSSPSSSVTNAVAVLSFLFLFVFCLAPLVPIVCTASSSVVVCRQGHTSEYYSFVSVHGQKARTKWQRGNKY